MRSLHFSNPGEYHSKTYLRMRELKNQEVTVVLSIPRMHLVTSTGGALISMLSQEGTPKSRFRNLDQPDNFLTGSQLLQGTRTMPKICVIQQVCLLGESHLIFHGQRPSVHKEPGDCQTIAGILVEAGEVLPQSQLRDLSRELAYFATRASAPFMMWVIQGQEFLLKLTATTKSNLCRAPAKVIRFH